jgi:signal transduction histidine kinase
VTPAAEGVILTFRERNDRGSCGTETPMRTRIIGLAVWASVLAIALFGVPLAVAVHQYSVQHERSDLARIARATSIDVSGDVENRDPIDADDLEVGGSVDVGVYDQDGDWLAGSHVDVGDDALFDALDGGFGTAADEGLHIVAVPITHSDDVVGAVVATVPRSEVWEKVLPAWTGMVALAALALGIVYLVGRRQARRLATPLEDLAVGARRLGDGDFSVRNPPGGVKEIDAVGSALNSTAGRLDDLLARERAFSADASHQLRTPLAGLRLRLEAALEQPDGDLRRAIVASLADADRLEATIEELLALARDTRATPASAIDLAALLGEQSPEWRERLAFQGRELELAIDPETPEVRTSGAAVRQVLRVLVDNASMHGGGTVTITVREASGAVAIDVSDEGAGVREPESVLFSRPADQRDGHGIGLALARRLAVAEGGRLELMRPSPPTFTLLLPSDPGESPGEQWEILTDQQETGVAAGRSA